MGLEIIRQPARLSELVADRRLYLTSDKARVVEEGCPEAAFLFATPGTAIPAEDVARFGLVLVDDRIEVAETGSDSEDTELVQDPDPAPAPKSRRRG